jgi:hypothetical protein
MSTNVTPEHTIKAMQMADDWIKSLGIGTKVTAGDPIEARLKAFDQAYDGIIKVLGETPGY